MGTHAQVQDKNDQTTSAAATVAEALVALQSDEIPKDINVHIDVLWELKMAAKHRAERIKTLSDALKARFLRRKPENRDVTTALGHRFRLADRTRREVSLSKIEKAALKDPAARKLLEQLEPYITRREVPTLLDNLP